ncbi:MAG: sulfotransferase [Paracoccaceae bacterium]
MPTRHIILTLGRSGSNTLVDMLNQNPEIFNFGELLGEWNQIRKLQRRLGLFKGDDKAYINAVLGNATIYRSANIFRNLSKARSWSFRDLKKYRDIRTVGGKEFSLNLHKYSLKTYPFDEKNLRVIGLKRTNVLERMISNEFLAATGVVLSRSVDTDRQNRLLHLEPDTVIRKLEIISAENRMLTNILHSIEKDRLFTLEYEDLYLDPERTIKTVRGLYSFLGVSDFTPRIRMTKIIKKNPLDSLENGDQIREIIAGSQFAKWLPRKI